MSQRATCWSVTINMKNVAKTTADECIQQACAAGWQVEGQLEKGEEGTEHYQLMVSTPQMRFSAIKKMFPTAHIEVARKPQALKAYVHKEDTREGMLPEQTKFYPSVNKMWELMFDWTTKEYPDYFENMIKDFQRMSADKRLRDLDERAAGLIEHGYFVEHHVVNPQVRSGFAKFAPEIIRRTQRILEAAADRQTDRQTTFSSDVVNIPTQDDASEEDSASSSRHSEEPDEEDGEDYGSDDSPSCADDCSEESGQSDCSSGSGD